MTNSYQPVTTDQLSPSFCSLHLARLECLHTFPELAFTLASWIARITIERSVCDDCWTRFWISTKEAWLVHWLEVWRRILCYRMQLYAGDQTSQLVESGKVKLPDWTFAGMKSIKIPRNSFVHLLKHKSTVHNMQCSWIAFYSKKYVCVHLIYQRSIVHNIQGGSKM